MISFFALYCSWRFALEENANGAFQFSETEIRDILERFCRLSSDHVILFSSSFQSSVHSFCHSSPFYWNKSSVISSLRSALFISLTSSRISNIALDRGWFLDHYYQRMSDACFSTVSCSDRLGLRFQEDVSWELDLDLAYTDLIFSTCQIKVIMSSFFSWKSTISSCLRSLMLTFLLLRELTFTFWQTLFVWAMYFLLRWSQCKRCRLNFIFSPAFIVYKERYRIWVVVREWLKVGVASTSII